MTRDYTARIKDGYQNLARECLASDTPAAMIAGVCQGIALSEEYTDAQKGWRLQLFFKVLEEEQGLDNRAILKSKTFEEDENVTKEDLMQIKQLLDEQKKEIIQECTANMNVIIESQLQPQMNLIFEKFDMLEEKMLAEDRIVNIEDRLDMLEAAVRLHGREIAKLKKAQ